MVNTITPADLARRSQVGAAIFALSMIIIGAVWVTAGDQIVSALVAGMLTGYGWRMMRHQPRTSKWWGP